MLSSHISEVSQQLACGRVTAAELLELCLRRAEHVRPLNAFISLTTDMARQQATTADRRLRQGSGGAGGPLCGVPVAVKDNFCVSGAGAGATTCGSLMLRHYCAPYTATVVRRLLHAGAVLLGKTNLDEFAMGVGTVDSYFGATKNIWGSEISYRLLNSASRERSSAPFTMSAAQLAHAETAASRRLAVSAAADDFYIAGGSSGGSAVAVASGACFAALGSDTGGSARNPAASCGLVALKPSYGRLSRHGLIPLVNSMDTPAVIARCVRDVSTVFNVIDGCDELDSTCVSDDVCRRGDVILDDDVVNEDGDVMRNLVVGVPVEYHVPSLHEDVLACWERVAAMMAEAGATVKQVHMPHAQLSIACYSVLNCAEVASNMARYDGVQFGYRAPPSASTAEHGDSRCQHDSTEAMYAAGRARALNSVVRERILAGNFFLLRQNYDVYVQQAMRLRRLIQQDFENAWRRHGCHLLVTPVTVVDGISHSEFVTRDSRANTAALDVFTQPANMAGVPAVSIPVTVTSRGLPISVQLMAPMFQEKLLLSAARWLEGLVDFPRLHVTSS